MVQQDFKVRCSF